MKRIILSLAFIFIGQIFLRKSKRIAKSSVSQYYTPSRYDENERSKKRLLRFARAVFYSYKCYPIIAMTSSLVASINKIPAPTHSAYLPSIEPKYLPRSIAIATKTKVVSAIIKIAI